MEGMGTLHFKSSRCLAKCLLSTSGLTLRKDRGWGVIRVQNLWGGVSRKLLWGPGTSQASGTLLDAVLACPAEHGSRLTLCGACLTTAICGCSRIPQKCCTMECLWQPGSCSRNRYMLVQWEGLKCHLVGCLSHPQSSEKGCGSHGLHMCGKPGSNLTFSSWYKGGREFDVQEPFEMP